MHRVHMVREPEAGLSAALQESLKGKAAFSFGPEIHPECSILVEGQLTEEHMAQCPNVRHVVIPFAGLQPKTGEVLRAHPGVSAHNLHHNAAMTAEMAMALLLACARRIVTHHNEFAQDSWQPRYFSRDSASLEGKTALVLGFGEVGRRVGRACEGFEMNVVAVRSTARDGAHGVDDLDSLLPKADFLIVTVPGTPATEGLVGATQLALLPPQAIVVNVGRGKVFDERALYEALRERRIDSAGLDVWWQYPKSAEDRTPPSAFPFGSLDNVVMTPHVGGATRDAERARVHGLIELLVRIIEGDTGANRVDLERGY